MKKGIKTVALILTLAMLISVLPVVPLAESVTPQINDLTTDESPHIIKELTELRKQNEKHFELSDGTRMAAIYEDAVHYENENGAFEDIDNTLKNADTENYENTKAAIKATLSKKLKKDKTVQLCIGDQKLSWGFVNADQVNGKPEQQAESVQGDEAFLTLEKLTSRMIYENAFPGVDLEYIIHGSGIKENIILKTNNTQKEFYVEYKLFDLIPTQIDDQTIVLKNAKGQFVYRLTAPVMTDALGISSKALQLQIQSNQNNKLLVKLTADTAWLNAEEREYPVTIDPEVTTEGGFVNKTIASYSKRSRASDGVELERVSDLNCVSNFSVGTITENGVKTESVAFIRCTNLAYLDMGSYVTKAELYLNNVDIKGNIGVYGVQFDGDLSNLHYDSVCALANTVDPLDIKTCSPKDAYITFDVTQQVRENYYKGIQLILKEEDEKRSTLYHLPNTAGRPLIAVTYVNQKGISDRFSSHNQSLGRAGTVYINDLTGLIAVKREDFSYSAQGLSVTAGMNYIPVFSNKISADDFEIRYQWVNPYSDVLQTGLYTWQRGDGTYVYFTKPSGQYEFEDERGEGYKLCSLRSDPYITCPNGDIYRFNDNGSLASIENGDTSIDFTYNETGLYLTSATDSDGKVYTYQYDADWNLTSIAYKGGGNTVIDSVSYTYDNQSRLTSVNYNGEISSYAYDQNGLLKSITAPNGYQMQYTYQNTFRDGVLYASRVSQITEYSKNGAQGNSMKVSYGPSRTVYTDLNGMQEIIIFDSRGYAITTMNEDGLAVHQKQDDAGNFLGSTSVVVPTANLLLNHNLENGTANWTAYTTTSGYMALDSTQALSGQKSFKIQFETEATAHINQDFVAPEAGTYTLSAYMLTQNVTGQKGAGVYVQVQDTNGEWSSYFGNMITGTNTDWQRSCVTFDVPENAQKLRIFNGLHSAKGTVYVDANQLEKHKRAYDYNLFDNADFASGNASWSMLNASIVSDSVPHGGLDSHVAKLTGSLSSPAQINQTIAVPGGEGESFTLSFWAKLNNPLPENSVRDAKVIVYGERSDSMWDQIKDISLDTNLQNEWYKISESITLPADYTKLHIYVNYRYQQGAAYFDGFELLSGGYYDDTQQTQDQDDDTEQTVDDETEDETDSEISVTTQTDEETGITTTTIKDTTVNKITSVSKVDRLGRSIYYASGDTISEFGYEGEGYEITSESVTIDGLTCKRLTDYETQGNTRKVSITDYAGNTTSISADMIRALILETVDGKGHTTSYSYNALKNLVTLLDEETNKNTQFTYEHDQIKTILNSSVGDGLLYSFSYNDFGNLSSISVGSQPILSYTYLNNVNRAVSKITYGNGNIINCVYDDDFNLIRYYCGDSQDISYIYDEQGNMIKTVDNINNTVTKTIDGQIQVWSSSETTLLHSYIKDENGMKEEIENKEYTTTYGYNPTTTDDPKTTNINEFCPANTFVSYNDITQTVFTDDFGRMKEIVVKNGNTTIMRQIYTYQTREEGGKTLTSNQVSKIATTMGNTTYNEEYTYDENGNILTIKKNGVLAREYVYDALNRLFQEYDYERSKSYLIHYDSNGNASSIVYYSIVPNGKAEHLGTDSYNYAYQSDWVDRMTAYNGQSITYDDAGNPLSYRGASLTWENGRQLASRTQNGVCTTYQYNGDGMRTKKYISGENWNHTVDYKTVDGKITFESSSKGGLGIGGHYYKNYFRYDQNNELIGFDHVDYYDDYTKTIPYIYLKNLQGDIIGIVNASGQIVAQYTYDAWGKLLSVTDGNGNDVSNNENHIANRNPMRYRGYYYDADSGLYYLQSRYYDPDVKRFIQPDAAELIEGLSKQSVLGTNLYLYCKGDPVNRIDENGHWDTSLHEQLCKRYGLMRTTTEWNRMADDQFASDNTVTAPFHAKKKALEYAQYIFNLAIDMQRNSYKEFRFSNPNKDSNVKVVDDHLKYTPKSGYEKNKKVLDLCNTKSQKILNTLNNITNGMDGGKTGADQSRALFGLALHIIQDYFAHCVQVDAELYQSYVFGTKKLNSFSGMMCAFNDETSFSTLELEDNVAVFGWRYLQTIRVTTKFVQMYYTGKKIKTIKAVNAGKTMTTNLLEPYKVPPYSYGAFGFADWAFGFAINTLAPRYWIVSSTPVDIQITEKW